MNTVEKLLKLDAKKLKMPEKDIVLKLNRLGGEEIVFPCKAIDAELYAEIQEGSIEIRKGDIKKINMYEMKIRTLVEGCPDIFKSSEVMSHFDAPTPKELIKKLLLSGEIDELYNTINELSGYEKDDEDDIKNS
ncbi:phage tail assembly chaperone [Clostridium oryzae]|uniref:Phage XkdN-like protein n=1 Tax=Clostridium oryzae TaxID=1450648 RepID=A0A1V4IET7_9CLOT|nr:XkdN-like protein [Clostridium oryzae]OPJ58439.1 phage XkdN-like protein [Clostridium oryzae]